MSAARKTETVVTAAPETAAPSVPEVRRAGPSGALDPALSGFNPLAAQHRLLEREFHNETTDADVGHYSAATRLGIVVGGAAVCWGVVIGVIAAIGLLS
ncbi:hypothetical protein BZG35_05590 [Brevundimonas sp. LM2]|uniref:hypothetical protein n=1 Tax=Brevundimonas sp. LM2 TaxID=1938605 RepID=UPI000983A07A|nr:hypothetical protein [Brevundimonas sp. LM2]AQR61182.1 hypothetical protein BZG35_05590 [Brevundimonas sp. LM2]